MDVLLAAAFVLVSWQNSVVLSDDSISRFIRGLHYNMLSSAGHLFAINASSTVKCVASCTAVDYCTSALYDVSNGNCTFYQDILPTSTNILPSYIQFLVNKGRYCTLKGFKYSETYDICYLLDKSWIDYYDTKTFCRSKNASLIRIDTVLKQRFIENSINEDGRTKYYYISGDKLSGQWNFTDGPAISTFYWAPNQPSSISDYNCLMISTGTEYKWFNGKCYQHGETARICEMDIRYFIH